MTISAEGDLRLSSSLITDIISQFTKQGTYLWHARYTVLYCPVVVKEKRKQLERNGLFSSVFIQCSQFY